MIKNETNSLWVNVNIQQRSCMVHDSRCRHVSKEESRAKGIERNLDRGGWFEFHDFNEILNLKNQKYKDYFLTSCQGCFRYLYEKGVATKIIESRQNITNTLTNNAIGNLLSLPSSVSSIDNIKYEFSGLNSYYDSLGSLIIAGQVNNVTKEKIIAITVTVTLFDENKRVLDFATGYLSSVIISPNEKSSFKVKFISPPSNFSHYEISLS